MGGHGSGPNGPTQRHVVDFCHVLDSLQVAKAGFIVTGARVSAIIGWRYRPDGDEPPEVAHEVAFVADTTASPPWASISYACENRPVRPASPLADFFYRGPPVHDRLRLRPPEPGDDVIRARCRLSTTRGNFGHPRWHLHCPQCGRRTLKLYRPPSEKHFGCRFCWDLTYLSRLESHMTPQWYARMAEVTIGYDRFDYYARKAGWPEEDGEVELEALGG